MSRIGKTPIAVPKEATVLVEGKLCTVTGPKGTLTYTIPLSISLEQKDGIATISCERHDKKTQALFGFVRAHIANMVTGVVTGWSRTLELSGVGFRATMNAANVVLSVGFSHQVTIVPPPGITISVEDAKIVVRGSDKQIVGQTAANIRAVRVPEPYKGKGIKYQGEHIRKKAGKSAKAIGGGSAAAK